MSVRAPNNRDYFVEVDLLEGVRQCKYGHCGDGDADDDTEAPQSGAAAGRLLQHIDSQGVHPFGQRHKLPCRVIRAVASIP